MDAVRSLYLQKLIYLMLIILWHFDYTTCWFPVFASVALASATTDGYVLRKEFAKFFFKFMSFFTNFNVLFRYPSSFFGAYFEWIEETARTQVLQNQRKAPILLIVKKQHIWDVNGSEEKL